MQSPWKDTGIYKMFTKDLNKLDFQAYKWQMLIVWIYIQV